MDVGICDKVGLLIAPQNKWERPVLPGSWERTAEKFVLVSLMWWRDAKPFPVTAWVALFLLTALHSVVQFGGETPADWLVQINTSLCAAHGKTEGEFQILNVTETT